MNISNLRAEWFGTDVSLVHPVRNKVESENEVCILLGHSGTDPLTVRLGIGIVEFWATKLPSLQLSNGGPQSGRDN